MSTDNKKVSASTPEAKEVKELKKSDIKIPEGYDVVGLKIQEKMPLIYKGVRYDLAKLTDKQAELLAASKCSFVIKKK